MSSCHKEHMKKGKKMKSGGKTSSCSTAKMSSGGKTRGCGAATKGLMHSKKMG